MRPRLRQVQYLQAQIPSLEVVWDKTRNAFDTWDRAMELAGDDAAVHMEDDAILTVDFERKAEAEISQRPDELIQFFSRRGDDQKIGARYLSGGAFSCNVCHYFPPGMSRDLLELSKTWRPAHPEHPTGTDTLVQSHLMERKLRYWVVVPSLADHRIGMSMISSRRARVRQAMTFEDPAG